MYTNRIRNLDQLTLSIGRTRESLQNPIFTGTLISFNHWCVSLHEITQDCLNQIKQESSKFKNLLGATILILIIFAAPTVASIFISAYAQNAIPGKNTTAGGNNMTGENANSSSTSVSHKPYKCLIVHCV